MDRDPRGGNYFGYRRLALLENSREAGCVTHFFASINFEVICEWEMFVDPLLRAAAVRAPQALEVHFLREIRILST